MSSKCSKPITILMLLLFLAACGGDDDGAFSTRGTDGATDTPTTEDGSDAAARTLAIGTGQGSNFQEAVINASTTALSSGGSAQLSFSIVDRDNSNALMSGTPEPVNVTSRCLASSEASIQPTTITTSDGKVEFTYNAGTCSGTDTVTAELENGGTASVNMSIGSASATSLVASAPNPLSITPTGLTNATRGSQSAVKFTLVSANGAPISGKSVSFQLYPADQDGGAPTLLEPSQQTNNAGEASAVVRAGSDNRIVRVTASVTENGQTIATTSMPIAINTTLPTQAGFTIAFGNSSPNAWAYSGVIVPVTVFANDVNGVQVRDGLVSFTTTGGSIEGDCEFDSTGQCTVAWRSQKPRPDNGLATIVARTIGTDCEDEACEVTPIQISASGTLLMASDVNVEVNLVAESAGRFCATASGQAGGSNRTALPAGTTFEFEMDSDTTGEITSQTTSFTVGENRRDSFTSSTYCVSAVGPGLLKVQVTTPDSSEPVETALTLP